jgi:hypothetical protein
MICCVGLLLFGGCVVGMVGLFWDRTTRLLNLFSDNPRSHTGLLLIFLGLLVMAAGWGLAVSFDSGNAPKQTSAD